MPPPIGPVSTSTVTPRRPVTTPSFTPSARPDPLAVTLANGTSFSAVDRAALAAETKKALRLGADVPARVQDGPTCGLYALGMVMDYWDKKDARNLNPYVRSEDVVRWDSHSVPADTSRRLLDEAKAKGFTTQGEMFYASQLASLARGFGYKATVNADFTLEELHAVLDRGRPALIGFDVDQQGNPGLYDGKRAHWAVIEGHFEKDGVEYLVATHGWTGGEYVWRADDFMASVRNLEQSDFPAAPKNITRTLRARLVEVSPGVK
ncbi:MAG: C39 family peptidase [Myxococcales bacterium]|nr:C39 family peptidase [Myxococcales bacterium]